jgi:hypothetical protein
MVETEAEHGKDGGRDEVVALLIGVCGSTRKEVPGSESVGERWTRRVPGPARSASGLGKNGEVARG